MALPKKLEKLEQLKSDGIKRDEIKEYCFSEGGLLNNDIRRVIWPKIAHLKADPDFELVQDEVMKDHKDYNQVLLDVNRMKSLVDPSTNDKELEIIKDDVTRIVMNVLVKDKTLHYYQGFHDICFIFNCVLGRDLGIQVIHSLIETKFRKFMEENMDSTAEYLNIIYVLLKRINPALLFKIEEIGVEPTFAISWVITWFTHVLQDIPKIIRLYDIFVADDSSLMCIYSCVAIMMLSISDFHDDLTDFDEIFVCLTQMPKKCSVEAIVEKSLELYKKIPPEQLKKEAELHLQNFLRNQKSTRRITYPGRVGFYIYNYHLSGYIEKILEHPYKTALCAGLIYSGIYILKSYSS